MLKVELITLAFNQLPLQEYLLVQQVQLLHQNMTMGQVVDVAVVNSPDTL